MRELAGNSVQVDYAGISREFRESGRTLLVTFALALAFIYLVLAAQFESWIDPFVILLSVPLALTGGLLAQKLSEVSGVGLVTIQGNQKPAVRVRINPSALAGLGLGFEDIRLALTPGVVHVILSLREAPPSLRGFRIEDGVVSEIPVRTVPDEGGGS